jgi:hypothetical protein
VLCDQALETAEHLCLNCDFAREVWASVSLWSDEGSGIQLSTFP